MMAYFSNATEYEYWYRVNCVNCVHEPTEDMSCPVTDLHLLLNYQQNYDSSARDVLEYFIPTLETGFAGPCKMRYAVRFPSPEVPPFGPVSPQLAKDIKRVMGE